MKRQFVPIDPATIKRNERAGQTMTGIPGVPSASANIRFGHTDPRIARDILSGVESLIVFADGWVNRVQVTDERPVLFWYEVDAGLTPAGGDLLQRVMHSVRALVMAAGGVMDPDHSSLVFQREVHQMRHEPIPLFSYGYAPTEVECEECGERFPHTELESDDNDEGGWTNARCPRCGAWECCDLEFERLSLDGVPLGQLPDQEGRFERGSC